MNRRERLMGKRSATATVALQTRMRPPLHSQLVRAARHDKVSLNTEMLRRLERSFEVAAVGTAVEALDADLARIREQLDQRATEVSLLGQAMHEMFNQLNERVAETMDALNEMRRASIEAAKEAKHAR
jgi:predicted nuclease with TOPRIM domain